MRRLWLIDASYIFATSQQLYGRGNYVDYLLLRKLVEQRFGALWRGYYLNGVNAGGNEGRDRFHNWLQTARPGGPQLIVKLYGLKSEAVTAAYCVECESKVAVSCPHGANHQLHNQRQKGVDVGLATTALLHKERFDALVLTSGDGDLAEVVEHLSEQGKRIELAVFSQGVSSDLQARADDFLWIDHHEDAVHYGAVGA
jgi:hypothetical protein